LKSKLSLLLLNTLKAGELKVQATAMNAACGCHEFHHQEVIAHHVTEDQATHSLLHRLLQIKSLGPNSVLQHCQQLGATKPARELTRHSMFDKPHSTSAQLLAASTT
jgi:hypothetical protein